MAFDPWAQTNSGISRLNDTLTSLNQMQSQDATNARASRLSDLQFADAQAKQNATMQASGAPDLTTAYANEMERQKQQQILEHKQKGFQTYLSTIGVLDKMPNLDPQTKTAIGKEFLRQNPEFAPMVDNLKFIDSKGVKAARNFGEGELKDPSTGQPLPAGYYETEGVWTGDVANPVKLTAYKLASPPKVDHVPEGAAIPDGKGGYTVPAPKADKVEKGFDTIDLGDKVKVIPRDGSAPYTVKKGATPKSDNGMGGDGTGGMTPADINHYAEIYNATGNLPALGMGASTLRTAILKQASAIARKEGKTGGDVAADASDNKAVRASIVTQEKQVGSMGSFVKNIDKQVGRFEEISKDLSTADSRLLNIPIRALRGKVAGSPLQAKVDMYLTEISSETGKLASGATGSVAELSQGAREKWEKIHDPNLSMADLLSVLKETRHAGQMRMDSVNQQLAETKSRLRKKPSAKATTTSTPRTAEDYMSGWGK